MRQERSAAYNRSAACRKVDTGRGPPARVAGGPTGRPPPLYALAMESSSGGGARWRRLETLFTIRQAVSRARSWRQRCAATYARQRPGWLKAIGHFASVGDPRAAAFAASRPNVRTAVRLSSRRSQPQSLQSQPQSRRSRRRSRRSLRSRDRGRITADAAPVTAVTEVTEVTGVTTVTAVTAAAATATSRQTR